MSRHVDVKALVSHIVKGDGLDKCRICMGDTSQGQVHLEDTVMMNGEQPVTLSELLEVITGVEIEEATECPSGVCVTCASAALAAQEFRILVRSSEKLWLKAVSNLTSLHYDDEPEQARSICAFVTQNDLNVQTSKDYIGGEPKTVVNRLKRKRKTTRKPRLVRPGPTTKCPDCNKIFSSPYYLHDHFKNNGQRDACQICGTVTARGLAMWDHLIYVHNENPSMCQQCPAVFLKEGDLVNHRNGAHKPGVYTCTECGRSFPRKSTFEHHAQMHLVRTCRSCNVQFTNRSCYREHRNQCEPNAKPDSKTVPRNRRSNIRDPAVFICDYCNKKYNSRPQLKNHILWIHMDVRPYQCQWCGKRFYTPARMAEHTVVHTRVRNFECDICGAKLVSKMAAVYHRRRHTGEKPYKCDDCQATFISSSRRLEHAKRKHNKGTRIPCPLCSASFVRKAELKKHIDKAHNTESKTESTPQTHEWKITLPPSIES